MGHHELKSSARAIRALNAEISLQPQIYEKGTLAQFYEKGVLVHTLWLFYLHVCCLFVCFFLWGRISLCSSGWPGTCFLARMTLNCLCLPSAGIKGVRPPHLVTLRILMPPVPSAWKTLILIFAHRDLVFQDSRKMSALETCSPESDKPAIITELLPS